VATIPFLGERNREDDLRGNSRRKESEEKE